MQLRLIVLVLFLAAFCPAVGAAQDCSDLNSDDDTGLRALYYYALLAEAADTGMLPRWTCEPSEDDELGAPEIYESGAADTNWNNFAERELPSCDVAFPPCIRRLSSDELREGMYGWNDIVGEFRSHGRHIGVYEAQNGGPAYIVCDRSEFEVALFVELSELRAPVDDGGLLGWIVRPITWIVENALINEALETVTLRKNHHLSDEAFSEQVTAIRGTRLDRLPQWRATFNELLGESCVFDLMARVTENFMGENVWRYSVTGHSLGGAVAQYVAQHIAANSRSSEFRAFAFNAIGIEVKVDPEILQSFYIEGDPVSAFGNLIGRIQPGRSVLYTPPDTDEWITLELLRDLERHKLSSVQESLCDCMNGIGTLTITPEQP